MGFEDANGDVVSSDRFDAMAEEYEQGTWSGIGEVAMGRPKLYDEDLEAVSARLPKSRAAAVEAGARRRGNRNPTSSGTSPPALVENGGACCYNTRRGRPSYAWAAFLNGIKPGYFPRSPGFFHVSNRGSPSLSPHQQKADDSDYHQ